MRHGGEEYTTVRPRRVLQEAVPEDDALQALRCASAGGACFEFPNLLLGLLLWIAQDVSFGSLRVASERAKCAPQPDAFVEDPDWQPSICDNFVALSQAVQASTQPLILLVSLLVFAAACVAMCGTNCCGFKAEARKKVLAVWLLISVAGVAQAVAQIGWTSAAVNGIEAFEARCETQMSSDSPAPATGLAKDAREAAALRHFRTCYDDARPAERKVKEFLGFAGAVFLGVRIFVVCVLFVRLLVLARLLKQLMCSRVAKTSQLVGVDSPDSASAQSGFTDTDQATRNEA